MISNVSLIMLALLPSIILAQSTSSSLGFNVTALTAVNSSSALQCWQITSPFTTTNTPGTAGALNLFLSNTTNTSLTILPPHFNGGLHRAPSAQWVVFLSGLAHITLPNMTVGPETEAWVTGGKYGILFAGDTSDVSTYGHLTDYPGNADTVVLQVPVAGAGSGATPQHEVLYDGPCLWNELAGL